VVKATDTGSPALSVTKTITINVVDGNEPPTLTETNPTRSVSESAAVGSNVGAPLAITDTEGDTITCTLVQVEDDALAVSSTCQITVASALN